MRRRRFSEGKGDARNRAAPLPPPHSCRRRDRPGAAPCSDPLGEGQMGSARMGSLQSHFMFLTEGLFGYSHQPTSISPKVSGRTFFSPICQNHYFRSGPISLDPSSPQPSGAALRSITGVCETSTPMTCNCISVCAKHTFYRCL